MSLRDLFLALVIFGLLPFILASPYIGVLVWSWLGYMNPHRLTWGFAYSFPWVQLVAVTTMIAFLLSKKDKLRLPWTGVTHCFWLILAWTGLSTLFAFAPDVATERFVVFAKIMVLVFFTLVLVNTRERIHWLVWVIAASIGFYGVKGGLFVILTGGANHVLGPQQSFITDTNALALALCMVIPLMRYLQLQSEQKWVRVGLWVAMALTAVAVLGTYSRGGMLTLATVGVFLFWKTRGKFILLALAVVALPVMLSFVPQKWFDRMSTIDDYQQEGSAVSRINSWHFAANVALHRPLVGGGFRPYENQEAWLRYAPPDARKPREIHSIFFKVLGEQGFVGLFLFLLMLFLSWRNVVWVRRQTKDVPEFKWAYDLASMLLVSGVAYGVGGALLPLPYFDLAYQLLAVVVLVRVQVRQAMPVTATARKDARPLAKNEVAV